MATADHTHQSNSTRRRFIKTSTGAVVGATLAARMAVIPGASAAGSDVIKVGLIGCGGRGTGAAGNALDAAPGVTPVPHSKPNADGFCP